MRWTILLAILYINCNGQDSDIVIVSVPEIISMKIQGESLVIPLLVRVKNGYHIQANNAKDEFIIPSTVFIDGGNDFIVSNMLFPNPSKFTLTGDGKTLDVYDGTFEIKVHCNKLRQLPNSVYALKGKINYQACDSVRCFFPRTHEFFVNIRVE